MFIFLKTCKTLLITRSFKKQTALSKKAYLFLAGILFAFIGIMATKKSNHPYKKTDTETMLSQFTRDKIKIDGAAEAAWNNAKKYHIGIAMKSDLSTPAVDCTTSGEVRSLWDGALLYLLIDVNDTDISTAAKRPTDKDGLEVYFDLWNDKFPKYEEDDGIMRISSTGELSGSGVYADRLKAYAAVPKYNTENLQTGYTIELAINTGGIPRKNGSAIGIDFCIIDAVNPTNAAKYRIFWSDGNNKGLNDNSRWGTVVFNGYDGKMPMILDTFLLASNIKKAQALSRGIWMSEKELDRALANAKASLSATTQTKIDATNTALDHALKALRRKGKYPDPYHLPAVNYLPDPFTFFNGKKVKSAADWSLRRNEIKDLAQYYEYGYMPKAPEQVSAAVNGNSVVVTVQNKGKTASFNAQLTVPTVDQCGKQGPYPVIVSIDFGPAKANDIYLNAGYAVLSVIYSTIASDNYEHKGAFYTLYPYDVKTGNDVGTLFAWAWGASRGVDALTYLAKNNPAYNNSFDLKKIVVTGFSRCGKAALAAGLMDERFGVVSPGASGCGGAAAYRYDSFGNTPARKAPFGNVYSWGRTPGAEVLGDKTRHQGHNANEMLPRFLNQDRIYKTNTYGYGERLPYDHHEIIAAIAPRAVLVNTANDDYANNAEGDCIGLEGAKPVFEFLGAPQNLALNIRTTGEPNPRWGGAHWLDDNQVKNIVAFANMVFYDAPLSEELRTKFYANPYIPTFNTYYGGVTTMMPWVKSTPLAIK